MKREKKEKNVIEIIRYLCNQKRGGGNSDENQHKKSFDWNSN